MVRLSLFTTRLGSSTVFSCVLKLPRADETLLSGITSGSRQENLVLLPLSSSCVIALDLVLQQMDLHATQHRLTTLPFLEQAYSCPAAHVH